MSETKEEEKLKVGAKVSDFQILNELGRGSYGTVYKVVSLISEQELVMKKINIKHMKPKHQKEAIKEAQILRKLKHPNIIKYYTSFMENEVLYIIMEYADNGDLQQKIKWYKSKKQHFTEAEVWDIAWSLLLAAEYLHKNNIIHRDLKTLNLFLTKDKKLKVGDLGVSKIVSSQIAQQATVVGTPLYLAPELVKQSPYDYKVDLWAIGCVLYHVCALEPPFHGDNLITLGFNIVHKSPKPLPGLFSGKLVNLINKFLEKNPNNRPSAKDILDKFPNKASFIQQDRYTVESTKSTAYSTLSKKDQTRLSQGKIDVYDSKHQMKMLSAISDQNLLQNNAEKNKQSRINPYKQPQNNYSEKVKNDYHNVNVKMKDNLVYDILNKNEASTPKSGVVNRTEKSKLEIQNLSKDIEKEQKKQKEIQQKAEKEQLEEMQKLKKKQDEIQSAKKQQEKVLLNSESYKSHQKQTNLKMNNFMQGSKENNDNNNNCEVHLKTEQSSTEAQNLSKQNPLPKDVAITSSKKTIQPPSYKEKQQSNSQNLIPINDQQQQKFKIEYKQKPQNPYAQSYVNNSQNFILNRKRDSLKEPYFKKNYAKDTQPFASFSYNQQMNQFKARPYSAQIKSKSYYPQNSKEIGQNDEYMQDQNMEKGKEKQQNDKLYQNNSNQSSEAYLIGASPMVKNDALKVNNKNNNIIIEQKDDKQGEKQQRKQKCIIDNFEAKFKLNQQKRQQQFQLMQSQQYQEKQQSKRIRPQSANVNGYYQNKGFQKVPFYNNNRPMGFMMSPFNSNENSHKKIVTNYMKKAVGQMSLHTEKNPKESEQKSQQIQSVQKIIGIEPIKEVDEFKVQISPRNEQQQYNIGSYNNFIQPSSKQTLGIQRPQTANINRNRKKITLKDLMSS